MFTAAEVLMEYLWFYGSSAVGKRTAICRMLNDPDVRTAFSAPDDPNIIVVRGSGFEESAVQIEARSFAEDLAGIRSPCVAIKFQFVWGYEATRCLLDRRHDQDASHRIILLWAPWKIHLKLYCDKYVKTPSMQKDGVVLALRSRPPDIVGGTRILQNTWADMLRQVGKIVRYAACLGAKFSVEIRDASSPHYREIRETNVKAVPWYYEEEMWKPVKDNIASIP